MSTTEILQSIQTTALSHWIAKSNHLLIASFQVVHVFGFLLLLASLVLISLRLLDLILTQQSLAQIAAPAMRLLWLGLALAIASGLLMFIGSPRHYFYNSAFEVKIALLLPAIVAQATVARRAASLPPPGPLLARSGAVLTLTLWFAMSFAGRAIGFV